MVAVKYFPENTYFPKMLISGKGKYFSVFGCISKNFPDNIFWCLEKKKENTNPRKISSTIAISLAWSRDQRRELATARSRDRSEIAISHRRSRSEIAIWGASWRRREIAPSIVRSRSSRDHAAWSSDWRSAAPEARTGDRRRLEIDWLFGFFSSLARVRALSFSLSLFRKCFEVKMRGENHFRVKGENIDQPEVIFRKISFSVTAKHAENGENDFLKSFSPKTNAP